MYFPYLYSLIQDREKFYFSWSSHINNNFNIKTGNKLFQNQQNFTLEIIFAYSIIEWNKLDRDDRNSGNSNSLNNCKSLWISSSSCSRYLKFVGPVGNTAFDINNPYGLKFPARMCLGLNYLYCRKVRHSFQDCINPIFDYGLKQKLQYFFPSTAFFLNMLDNISSSIVRKLMKAF